jgi:RNase P/RNase MRP subunit POP5
LKALKRRYLAIETDSQETFSSHELMDAVWSAVSRLFGEYGASQTGLSFIGYDETERLLVMRASHKTVEMVRTALASITQVGNKPVALHVLAVSGTVRALHKRLGKH